MKNLVIVESPAKAKTIEKFLGKDYKVMSSYGHIRDLKKRESNRDLSGDFDIEYEIPAEKKSLVETLRREVAKADTVWLASDEDREGEAIAWHLFKVLELDPANTRRIVFHEITKPAILNAIANPRSIDLALVDAQQARRVLDRIVGFELSPVLWRRIKPALSAGRVQSVAVRLLCEREKEIRDFVANPYYLVRGRMSTPGDDAEFKVSLNKHLTDENDARQLLNDCRNAQFVISGVSVKPIRRSPAPPFTTSTLQQEAARRLGFSVSQTMMVAQRLYESGHITYMRTDSLNLSKLALAAIADTVRINFGKEYQHTHTYHTSSKGAQEAHEAIRPTYPDKKSISASAQEQKLYDLIWKRTIASQMEDARLEKTNVDITISTRQEHFEAQGEVVLFDGFMKVWDGNMVEMEMLPSLEKDMLLKAHLITATERFTQPQPRYTEGSLVKKLEELGIGRPSTYAPTISTIQARDYVRKGEKDGIPRQYSTLTLLDNGTIESEQKIENTGAEKGKLIPTDVGMVVNDFLTEYFPAIMDYNFTAHVEEKFDEIAEGKLPWKHEINDFYNNFHPRIEEVSEMRTEHKTGERQLGIDPESGKPVSVKIGRFGPVVQIGDASDNEKPRFASLNKEQSMATIILQEALKLFELPRYIGEYNGNEIHAAIGRFGPYIKYGEGKFFVSIPKNLTPMTITLDEAIALIEEKQHADANKVIKEYEELPDVKVLNGRYGPYIAYNAPGTRKSINYKIPKSMDPAALTAEQVREIMVSQDKVPEKNKTTRIRKKK